MTAFRSLTDAQLAMRHDPMPLIGWRGLRYPGPDRTDGLLTLAPRVECIPSRDPNPYECEDSGLRMAEKGDTGFWFPRAEFARPPVNPILAAFRDGLFGKSNEAAPFWLDWIEDDDRWTAAERDHARKVLARLAALA